MPRMPEAGSDGERGGAGAPPGRVRSWVKRRWIWPTVGLALLLVAAAAALQASVTSGQILCRTNTPAPASSSATTTQPPTDGGKKPAEIELTERLVCDSPPVNFGNSAKIALLAVFLVVAGTLVTGPVLAALSRVGAWLGIETLGTLSRLVDRLTLPDEYKDPDDIPWEELFEGARDVTIVGRFIYPTCVRRSREFETFLHRKGTTLTLLLPEVDALNRTGSLELLAIPHPDAASIPNYPEDTVKHLTDRISRSWESAHEWQKTFLHKKGGSKVTLISTGQQAPNCFIVLLDKETLVYSPYEIYYENKHAWPFLRVSQRHFARFARAAREDVAFFRQDGGAPGNAEPDKPIVGASDSGASAEEPT